MAAVCRTPENRADEVTVKAMTQEGIFLKQVLWCLIVQTDTNKTADALGSRTLLKKGQPITHAGYLHNRNTGLSHAFVVFDAPSVAGAGEIVYHQPEEEAAIEPRRHFARRKSPLRLPEEA